MRLVQLLTLALPWVAVPGVANPYLEPRALLLTAGLWGLAFFGFLSPLGLPPPSHWNPWLPWVGCYVILLGLFRFQWPYLARVADETTVVYNAYVWEPTVAVGVALFAAWAMAGRFFTPPLATAQLTQWYCLSLLLVCLYALGQWVGLDQFYVQGGSGTVSGHLWHGVRAGFGNPEHFGLYLALLSPLPLLFSAKRYLLLLSFLLVILLLTGARGCWLVAGVSLGSYGLARWWPRWALGWRVMCCTASIGLLIWLLPMVMVWASGDERAALWPEAWRWLLDRDMTGASRVVSSWTGRGLGSFAILSARHPEAWMHQATWAHNEWLQALIELGVIGTLLAAGLVVWTTRRAWRRAKGSLVDAGWFGVWVGWLAASVLYPVVHWPHLIWIGLCAWGVVERREGAYA